MLEVLLTLSLLAAKDDLGARMDVLRRHYERLGAFAVPADLEEEKETQLEELRKRLDAGADTAEQVDELYLRMDRVRQWLMAHAVEQPSLPDGGVLETEAAWTVHNPNLRLTIHKSDLAMEVHCGEATWHFRPSDATDVVLHDGTRFSLASARVREATPFPTGYSIGLLLHLADFPALPADRPLELHLLAHLIGNEIVFELAAPRDTDRLGSIHWPKALVLDNDKNSLSVIPLMQGVLVPGNWPQAFEREDQTNSRVLYMPWWGQIRNGHGAQTILETSDDAGAAYAHPAGGPTTIQPRWYASLGSVRYPRILRCVFDDQATYVRMAKRYRRYVRETGRFRSLEQKRLATPALDEVIGRPVIHLGALYHTVEGSRFYRETRMEHNHQLQTFDELAGALRELAEKGIDRAYVHLDGWGYAGYDNRHPDIIPPGYEQGGWDGLRRFADTCEELGYLFAVHDQYRDFYLDAVSFGEHLAVRNRDGGRTEHAEWQGGKQTFLSPRFAPGYVRRNHDAFIEHGVHVRGAYLDVFAVVPLEESFSPSHPVTRTDCARYRAECCELLRARGYVVSSEEPADYLVPAIDLVHHGPYSTLPKGYGPGARLAIPVPLWSLVYHDALLVPWAMGDAGGWGIPDEDAAWQHCMLNAGLPYVGPGAGEEQIARVKEAAALARRLGTQEMTNHEFLDPTWRVQRATYTDGTQVTVDFEQKTCRVTRPGEQ